MIIIDQRHYNTVRNRPLHIIVCIVHRNLILIHLYPHEQQYDHLQRIDIPINRQRRRRMGERRQ